MRISGGLIVTMDPQWRVIPNGVLDIEKGRITYVGTGDHDSHGETIDARGKAVLPGFVNTHTHIASNILARGLLDGVTGFAWLERLWKLKENFTSEDLFVASRVGIAEMLLSGTTCYNELFDGYDPVPGISAMQETGVRAAAGWCLADGGVYADTAEQSWRDVANFGQLKQDFHATADGRVELVIAPHAPYTVSEALARAARKAADDHGLRLHTHLAEGTQEINWLREHHDKTPVEYFADCGLLGPDLIAAHCCQFDEQEVKLFAKTGASIAHCPTCNSRSITGYLPIGLIWDAGIRVGLGTDGPASNNSLDMLAEAKFATTLHRFVSNDVLAISAERALSMATIDAARAMGLDASIGSLETGKKADVILIDLAAPNCAPVHNIYGTLIYSCSGSNVDTVLVEGRVLVEDGQLLRTDTPALVVELNERANRLTRISLPGEDLGEPEMRWR
jgi:5-methylthioadenosine/S-adenosylhomocysteine deaminase